MSEPALQFPLPSPSRYSSAAIFLHWTLAALLLFQLSLGWRLDVLDGVPRFVAFQLHKSIGIAILLLSLARIAIRLMVRRPASVEASPLLAFLASATHGLLYFVMIAGPLTGWIVVSTAKVKLNTMLFGLVPWPHLPLGSAWSKPAETAHGLIGLLLAGLIVLHVVGALRHHLLREDLIARMMPRAVTSRNGLTIATVVAVLGGFGALATAKLWPFSPPATVAAAAQTLPVPVENVAALAPVNVAVEEAVPVLANAATTTNEAADEESASAAAVPWRVQTGGKLGFSADYSGAAIEGSFKRWEADILFGPDDLANSRISVSVDLASVDSADSERDTMLTSDSFFNVAAHPRATFRSSKISHRGGNAYRAAGTLSLHGQQQPATLDFTLVIKGDEATASGSATLSRTAFKVGTGEWASTDVIKDGVSVRFSLKAKRTK